MELKVAEILLLTLIFVAFVEADPCGKRYLECFDAYGSASLEEKTEAEKCSDKRRLARCLTEVVLKCHGDDYWKENNEKAFREAEECNVVLEDCLDKSITVTSALACVEKSLRDFVNYVNHEKNRDRMVCTLTSFIVRCMLDDASEKCGQDAPHLVVSKLMTTMPEEFTEELMQHCTE